MIKGSRPRPENAVASDVGALDGFERGATEDDRVDRGAICGLYEKSDDMIGLFVGMVGRGPDCCGCGTEVLVLGVESRRGFLAGLSETSSAGTFDVVAGLSFRFADRLALTLLGK